MAAEHFHVLIAGAGLSGIGAASQLQMRCPDKTCGILEARASIGGTWDLFRYPGIRSDSDMYTMEYRFRPWSETRTIADGASILNYIRQTASEHGVDRRIRFQHRVIGAEWNSADARWTVEVIRGDVNETVRLTSNFLFVCCGYYRYDEGYTPAFGGAKRFAGRIVHPQHWSDDIDYQGKRVLIIGSGATAVTLAPAIADHAAHVTILQRSPSYIVSLPSEDQLANRLGRSLPSGIVHPLVRWKNVLLMMYSFQLSRRRPDAMKAMIRAAAQRQLPAGYDVEKHFNPRYDPWDQRLCVSADGDLFRAIRHGSVSMVTDRVDTFTETGVKLESGSDLEADLIVTATGLNMRPLGDIQLVVDGREVKLAETMCYKGAMLSGVPNLAFTFGYTNASWTLKSDLTCEYVCRLLRHMDKHRYRQCVPVKRDRSARAAPFIDFSSGYVRRSIDQFPRQGSKRPWRLYQNYARDILVLRFATIDDGAMAFSFSPHAVEDPKLAVAEDSGSQRDPSDPSPPSKVATSNQGVDATA
jgi:cation diffusion facilitator CzcD-associated flavoprotein CzcO